jgi:hypothetical protein
MDTSDKVEVKQLASEAPKVIELGHVSEETKGHFSGQSEGNPPLPFGQM